MDQTDSPAKAVIDKFGGIDATAKAVGRHRSVVNRWLLPKESGGTGGIVPSHHQQTLLDKAPELGIPLAPVDFFSEPEPEPEPEPDEAAA